MALFNDLPENEKNNKLVHSVNAYLKKLHTKSKKTYPYQPSVDIIRHDLDNNLIHEMWLELSSQYVNDHCHENDEFLRALIKKTVQKHKKTFIENWSIYIKEEDLIRYGRLQGCTSWYTCAMLKKDMLRNFDQDEVEEALLQEAWSCHEQSMENEDDEEDE